MSTANFELSNPRQVRAAAGNADTTSQAGDVGATGVGTTTVGTTATGTTATGTNATGTNATGTNATGTNASAGPARAGSGDGGQPSAPAGERDSRTPRARRGAAGVPTGVERVSEARERLLRTAGAIFYAEGIHGIGVDRVIVEARVTRATFYRHFPGKEDLVVAYLRSVDDAIRGRIGDLAQQATSPDAFLRDVLTAIGDDLCRPGFRGCAFINAAAEYPDPASPVHRAVLTHRDWLARTLVAALTIAGHPDAARAGSHLVMLRDGAVVAAYLGDASAARDTFARGVDAVLREALVGRYTAPR